METNSISSAFQERIKTNILFMLIALVACILVTTVVFINYNQRIVAMENLDELTGLSNRKLFAKQYLSFIRKHREQAKTLFMFDIDNFKDVNDTYGHMYGNTVLAKVGDALRSAIDGYGFAARWGGDEFLGILSVKSDEACQILSQFMDTLKNAEHEGFCITVSIGILEINEKLSMEQLIKKVDEAMYHSKENGRNRITICGL
jgi:diguanylate cyclase (GGDEF)-like protein